MRFAVLLLAAFAGDPAFADGSFNVVASCCSNYMIDTQPDPLLTLERGNTYTFNLIASGHPFFIKTQQVNGSGSAYNNGVSNNGGESGVLTFVVPTDAPATLFYNCGFHSAMGNRIDIINPLPVFTNGFEGP